MAGIAVTESQPNVEFGLSARSSRFTPIVKKYAEKYGVDWVLVLAVMKQESSFNHAAVSRKGAYGLMQIMPHTRSELEDRLGVRESLSPKNNIRAGIYHLRRLSYVFRESTPENRIKLTLAAYNAGLTRLKDAQDIVRYLGDDPKSWESVRSALPLLSRRYYTLHQDVWPQGKPKSGYFGNSRETISYVDRILENYGEYTLAIK